MLALSDHDISSLSDVLARGGHNPSNARRVLRAYWERNGLLDVHSLDIAKSARAFLCDQLVPKHSQVTRRHVSADGTIKLLIGFTGGGAAECVLMPSHRPDRAAACISSPRTRRRMAANSGPRWFIMGAAEA